MRVFFVVHFAIRCFALAAHVPSTHSHHSQNTSTTTSSPTTAHAVEGLLQGFAITEKADRVAGVLGPAGPVNGFSRLGAILGRGSTSLNNLHEFAHECGT
jgi:uncharacterized protein YbcC (UPF0753/DUF2309 family)